MDGSLFGFPGDTKRVGARPVVVLAKLGGFAYKRQFFFGLKIDNTAV